MRSIKFIHTADLHLGSPLKSIGSVSENIRKQLQNATFTALERIVDAALRYKVDFVLFAGDVYDADARSIRANRHLAEQLGRLGEAGIPAFLIGGNHDPVSEHQTDPIALPANVHAFNGDAPTREVVAGKKTPLARITGQSYRGRSDSRRMFKKYAPPDTEMWNIGMLHTALEKTGKSYVPCTVEDLQAVSGIDYWALGHIHKRQVLSTTDPVIAYPGNPQGRDIGEAGLRGCLLAELFPHKKPRLSLVPTGSILWELEECAIDAGEKAPPETLDELVELMSRQTRELLGDPVHPEDDLPMAGDAEDLQELVEGFIVRWRVTGRGEIHETLIRDREESAEYLAGELNKRFGNERPFLWTESVQVRTGAPVPSLEELAGESEIFTEIAGIIRALQEADAVPDEVAQALGTIWETNGDSESLPPDQFLVTDSLLSEMYDEVKLRVVEALLARRESA